MGSLQEPSFTGGPLSISCSALLFDFDGTIIDSTAAIVKHWQKSSLPKSWDFASWARSLYNPEDMVPKQISSDLAYHYGDFSEPVGREIGVDPNVILASSHGRRSIDVLKLYDPSKANWNYISEAEGRIPREFGNDAVEIPGARKLLASLDDQNVPWAVVTSGTRPLVHGWLDRLQLAEPKTMVTAEDVENGKPDPACYLLGRSKLRMEGQSDLVVLEDAPSGIKAGKLAGFKVIGLATTHTLDQVKDAGADWILEDLHSVSLKTFTAGKVELELKNILIS